MLQKIAMTSDFYDASLISNCFFKTNKLQYLISQHNVIMDYWSFSVGFKLSSSLSFCEVTESGWYAAEDAKLFGSSLTAIVGTAGAEAIEAVLLWSILLWGDAAAGRTAKLKIIQFNPVLLKKMHLLSIWSNEFLIKD